MLMNGRKYLTANEILNGEYYSNWECFRVPENVQSVGFEAIKQFVAGTARGDRRRRILGVYSLSVQRCGILNRLWYYPKTGEVEYCCGQEWNSEMAVLRDIFDYKKRKR